MDERERHAAGMAVRRAVLGDAQVDRAVAGTEIEKALLQAAIYCDLELGPADRSSL